MSPSSVLRRRLRHAALLVAIACAIAPAYADDAAPALADAIAPAAEGRSDPARDGQVATLLGQQAAAARRVAVAQIGNVQDRLRALHHGDPAACRRDGGSPWPVKRAAEPLEPAAIPASQMPGGAPAVAPASLPLASCQRTDLATAWTAGALEVGSGGANAGGDGFGFHSRGVTFGVDSPLADGMTVGVALGLAHEHADASSDGTANAADAVSAMAYFSFRPWREMFVDAVAGHGGLKMKSTRRVEERRNLSGDRRGTERFASLAAGYRLAIAGADVAPYTRVEVLRAALGSFADVDDSAEALQFQRQTVPSMKVAVGLEGSSQIDTRFGSLMPRGRLELRRELERIGAATMSYADDPSGTAYAIDAAESARSSLSLGVGATLALRRSWSIGADYSTDYSSNTRVSRIDLKLSRALP